MNELILIILMSLGSLFVLLAAIGLVRMPDLYLRISVTTKAATLGIGLILVSAAVYFQETSVTTRILAHYSFYSAYSSGGSASLGQGLLHHRSTPLERVRIG
jgi:multicomponent Na+:H+ antiporter subunit G